MTRSLRKVSLACLCALSCVAGVRAQADKLDAYGDVNCETALAHLDNLAAPLYDGRDAEAHVIVYDGRPQVPGKVLRHVAFVKDYLTEARGIDARRVHVLQGGRREEFTVELFVVAKGASPPRPTPTVTATAADDALTPREFDEGPFGFERDARGRAVLWDGADAMCPFSLPDLAGYAKLLRAEPEARAHVVVYGGRGQRYADVNTLSRLIRHRLFNAERIPHGRITLAYGGRRDEPFVELWVVPRGARTPPVSRR